MRITIEVGYVGMEEMKVISGAPMIVVTESPSDFPGKFVARLWDVCEDSAFPTAIAATADSLQEIRQKIPFHMMCVPRFQEDDPCVVEVYI